MYDIGQRPQVTTESETTSYDMTYDIGQRLQSHILCHDDVMRMSYDMTVALANVIHGVIWRKYDIMLWRSMTLGRPHPKVIT